MGHFALAFDEGEFIEVGSGKIEVGAPGMGDAQDFQPGDAILFVLFDKGIEGEMPVFQSIGHLDEANVMSFGRQFIDMAVSNKDCLLGWDAHLVADSAEVFQLGVGIEMLRTVNPLDHIDNAETFHMFEQALAVAVRTNDHFFLEDFGIDG